MKILLPLVFFGWSLMALAQTPLPDKYQKLPVNPQPIRQPLVTATAKVSTSLAKSDHRTAFVAVAVALGAATVYDIETTHYAVTKQGAVETNPIFRPLSHSRPALYGASAVLDAGILYWTKHQRSKGHRYWWIIPVAATGLHLFAGTHNLHD